ncbi:IS3 family transposase [Lactobacillus melliventris]|uniref:IS3 family transposase n=1 Tax=Lactobacillus melliventris TaxID=1218507 RepID=UPI003CC7D85C
MSLCKNLFSKAIATKNSIRHSNRSLDCIRYYINKRIKSRLKGLAPIEWRQALTK